MEEKVHFSLKTCLGLFCQRLLHEKQTTQTNIKKHRFCIPDGFCQFRDFSFSAMCPVPYKIKEAKWAAGNAPTVLSSRASVLAAAAQGARGFGPDQAWESQGAFPLRVPKGILFLDNLHLQKARDGLKLFSTSPTILNNFQISYFLQTEIENSGDRV